MIPVGVDEAGAGCLYGPVSAAAVVLGDNFPEDALAQLADSKVLSKKKREKLFDIIQEHAAACTCAFVSPGEIDKINILQARMTAMHRALDQISADAFDVILVDGNRFRPYKGRDFKTIIKGDRFEKCISAASIIAKVTRDRYIAKVVSETPELDEHYGLGKNMGYPTKMHKDGIEKHGVTGQHRLTFGPCKRR
jgi:ribonuclease HII